MAWVNEWLEFWQVPLCCGSSAHKTKKNPGISSKNGPFLACLILLLHMIHKVCWKNHKTLESRIINENQVLFKAGGLALLKNYVISDYNNFHLPISWQFLLIIFSQKQFPFLFSDDFCLFF